ncbi:hypothetical protein NKH54_13990 [Mesorhizobium sp. M1004]|uniref:hypothetical protein n=1 Tax=Mesorhizobium sp. M1004 TaxID=2957046 RepID=UPI00333C0130
MPGTAEDPVRLGPFERIISVHWGNRYFAIQVRLVGNFLGYDPIPCSPHVQTIDLNTDGPWTGNGLKTYYGGYYPSAFEPVSDEDKIQNALIYGGGGWHGIAWGGYGVAGLPDWPTGGQTGFANWTYANPADGSLPQLRAGSALATPFDIPVPLEGGPIFDEGLDVAMVSKVDTFTGGQVCTEIFLNPGVFTLYSLRTTDSSSEVEMTYPADSITITYHGKTYEAVATKLISTQRLWILCERSPSGD